MQKTILVMGMLSAWAIALVFDLIERMTGARVIALLCTAMMVMVFSLYAGLRPRKEVKPKEGS